MSEDNRVCPQGTFRYVVRDGDTFWLLAQRYHTTVEAIQRANPHVDPLDLQTGMVLCIPGENPPRHCPPGTFTHTVEDGDTFWKLAQRFHTTVQAIERANPGVDPLNLQSGQVICIPEEKAEHCGDDTFPYTIEQGDTFWKLAQRYHTTVEAIRRANPGVDPLNLQPGQVICIPICK